MPSVSKKQHNFMAAVANNPKFAKKAGVPSSVGKEFLTADKGKTFKKGGEMKKFPDKNKDGKVTFKDVLIGRGAIKKSKGGYVDMSEEHEGMESKAEEAKEYAMEEKGYKETKSGKMVKKKTKKKKK